MKILILRPIISVEVNRSLTPKEALAQYNRANGKAVGSTCKIERVNSVNKNNLFTTTTTQIRY
jgi:hypothetical protein